MTNEKKEVEVNSFREDLDRRSTLKVSYIIVGLMFFLGAIAISIAFENSFFFSILMIIVGVLFFVTGISYYDYGELVEIVGRKGTDKDKLELIYKKYEWHNEIDISLKIAFGIGGLFFVIAIFMFIANPREYLLAILFCDCIGATTLTYAFKLNDYREKIEEYEKTLEDLEKQMHDKNWNFQGMKKESAKKDN
jgi:hypothetical protein